VLEDGARRWLMEALREHRREEVERWAPFASLTRKEGQVLALLMEGHAAEEIAASQSLAITTIRSQIRSILQKLGVSSQLAAAALAHAAGWKPERS